jgi:beta-glucanase (GH16 family)
MARAGVPLTLAAALAVGAGVSIAGAAKSNGFRDDFTTFDSSRWLVSSRPFGYGTLDPADVTVANGQLGIRLPGGTTNGGEMRTRSLYRFGTYRARLKLADAPSSLTAFFLYRAPDYQQEIDIELFNDSSGRVMLSTYSGGSQTNTVTLPLGFDPTADFHVYEIDYGPGSVGFRVDGTLLQNWTSRLPRSSMFLYLNAWFPSWLAGQAPSSDRATYADWIDYTSG